MPPTYYRGCWHVVSRGFLLRYRHFLLPSEQKFTTQRPSSFTRRCCIRVSPIVQYSPLLPPVGVWTVSQFQCGRSSSQTCLLYTSLRCLQRLSLPDLATLPCRWPTADTPVVRPSRSSRTKDIARRPGHPSSGHTCRRSTTVCQIRRNSCRYTSPLLRQQVETLL